MLTATDRAARLSMPDEQEVSLRDYVDFVRRRYWIILAAFAITFGGAIGMSMARAPVYRASTTLATDKTPPLVLLDTAGEELTLFPDRAAAQAPDVPTLTQLVRSELVLDGAMARLAPVLGPRAAAAVLGSMSVQPVEDAQLVRITVEYVEPRAAALGANAVAGSLIDMNLKARRRRITDARQFIQKQLALARERLQGSEAGLVAFKNRHGDVSLAEDTSLKLQRLAELEAQRVNIRLPRLEEQSLAIGLQRQLATLEIDLHGLRQSFTSKHPSRISTEARILETKRRLEAELDRNRKAEHLREAALAQAIKQYERQLQRVPPLEADLARFTRNMREAEQIYLLLSSKLQQAIIAEASIGSSVQVIDVAKTPDGPISSGARRRLLFGAALGLILGVGIAITIDQLDDTVRTAEDVERVLHAPVLGTIPLRDSGKANVTPWRRHRAGPPTLTSLERSSPEAEAYRALRTHVLSLRPDVGCLRLLITSPLPNEGKSTIAANLAVALARADRQVWLVDADLRHSSLDSLFPEADSPGLAALLAGTAEEDGVVRPTHEPRLWFVASGADAPNPAELLGGQRMTGLMDEARERCDVALIDSPAILPVTDAEVLGRYVDGVLMVVAAGGTDRGALAEARQRLDRLGVRMVGAVLNRVPVGSGARFYNTHYRAYYSPEEHRRGT